MHCEGDGTARILLTLVACTLASMEHHRVTQANSTIDMCMKLLYHC